MSIKAIASGHFARFAMVVCVWTGETEDLSMTGSLLLRANFPFFQSQKPFFVGTASQPNRRKIQCGENSRDFLDSSETQTRLTRCSDWGLSCMTDN
jgi:hypothetical protein